LPWNSTTSSRSAGGSLSIATRSLFGCLTDENAPDVADPVYAPEEVFGACFDQIDRGIRRLVEMRNPASRPLDVTRGVRS
jgi:protein-tyrosine-phosphatase